MLSKKYSKILFIFFMGLGMSLLMTLIITYINTGYDEMYIKRQLVFIAQDITDDTLDENKSGAACIPWETIDKAFIKEGIFTALGYGFNLYDIKIAKKAALEGCERMRRANKIESKCKCEMVLYNNDILVEYENE